MHLGINPPRPGFAAAFRCSVWLPGRAMSRWPSCCFRTAPMSARRVLGTAWIVACFLICVCTLDAHTLAVSCIVAFSGLCPVVAAHVEQYACVRRRASTALLLAAEAGHKSVAELLLSCGADVNAKPGRSAAIIHSQQYFAWEWKSCYFRFINFREHGGATSRACSFAACAFCRTTLTAVQH
jgi:hypothetical protein